MAQMNISNTLFNDDSSGVISYAEQLSDRLIKNYINTLREIDKTRLEEAGFPVDVDVFQKKLNEFFLKHWVDFQRFLKEEGVDPTTIDSWHEVQEFLKGLPDDEARWLQTKITSLETSIANIDHIDGGAFDISSANNVGGVFATFSGLGTALAAVPALNKKSGMAVRFIKTDTNEYEQYRYNLKYEDTTAGNAAFLNIENWVPYTDVEANDVVGDPVGDWVQSDAEAYIDGKLQDIKNWVSNTPETEVIYVEAADWPLATGQTNRLYRVAGTTSYSEYGWDGTQFVLLDIKEYGIDNEPTAGSNNLVKSGGVYEEVSQLDQEVNGKEIQLYAQGMYNSWISNRYIISSNGLLNTSSINSVTDFIDVSSYAQLKCIVNTNTAEDSGACVAFYDESNNYLSTCILGTVGTQIGHQDIIADIPNGAKYARFTCRDTERNSWFLTGVITAKSSLTDAVVGAYETRLTNNDIVSGKYRNTAGEIANSAALCYSLPIKVSCGDKVVFLNALVPNTCAFITRVSELGECISVVKAGESLSVLTDYEIEIDFDGYISITANLLEYKMVSIIKATIHKVIEDSKASLSAKIDTLDASVEELTQIVAEPPINLTNADITSGYYRTTSGGLASLSGYCYSKPFLVKKGTRIITTEAIELVSAVSVISEVNSENGYIRTLKAGTGNAHTYNYEVEQDCYIGLSFLVAQLAKFRIVAPNLKDEVNNLSDAAIKVESKTRLLAFGASNPLQTIIRECGYGCLLKTWGFIGDSYTSGETPAYEGSTLKYLDCYKWSWGQQFMKIIGSEGYNFSNGGQTAKGWLRSQGVVRDESYYGGVGGGDWRLAQIELKQGYIISLGINDKSFFGQTYLGATYSLGDITTDINVSDYTQNNENTFAGCYAGIIQRLLSVQPKAKIFCITQFQDNLEEINDVVRDIVALFPNNVFLIDLHDYALDITEESYYMSNGHPTPLGYAYMAACINTYVDYIIRNNKQKFMDVTLIGSDYTLSSN